jgi:adenine phosphoribosyltransferase
VCPPACRKPARRASRPASANARKIGLDINIDAALGLITEVPDFPEPGVLFRDLTPLFVSAEGFATVVETMASTLDPEVELLAAVEARGFLLAAAVGYARGIGVVPVRKPGKLPAVAGRVEYSLEYGTATLELPAGAVRTGQRVVVIDDVLATGGTVAAACKLLEDAGAVVDSVLVVLELAALGGRNALPGRKLHTLQVC